MARRGLVPGTLGPALAKGVGLAPSVAPSHGVSSTPPKLSKRPGKGSTQGARGLGRIAEPPLGPPNNQANGVPHEQGICPARHFLPKSRPSLELRPRCREAVRAAPGAVPAAYVASWQRPSAANGLIWHLSASVAVVYPHDDDRQHGTAENQHERGSATSPEGPLTGAARGPGGRRSRRRDPSGRRA